MANSNNDFLSKATEYAGNKDLVTKLLNEINKELDEFDHAAIDLLRKSMIKIQEIIAKTSLEIDNVKNRESFIGMISLNVIEQLIDVLLQSASEIGIFSKLPQSLFVFKAAEMFERVTYSSAMKTLSNSIMENILKNKPIPSKENLS
jgi:hypothetical protein